MPLKMKYFVLNPYSFDEVLADASRCAMRAYAVAIEKHYKELADDLMLWVRTIESNQKADVRTKKTEPKTKDVAQEKELAEQFDLYDDNDLLAGELYNMSHDTKVVTTGYARETIMEARDNLIGLYDLCERFVNNQNNK